MPGDSFNTYELRSWRDPQPKNFKSFITNHPASSFPIGLNMIDTQAGKNPRVRAYADNVAPADSTFENFKADFHLDGWHDTVLYGASCSWLDVSKHSALFQFGSLDTARLSKDTDVVQNVTFHKWHFDSTPKVVVWLSAIDISHSHNARIFATATNITPSGFKLHIGTWHTTTVYESTVHWIAIPSDLPNITAGSFCTQQKEGGPEKTYSQQVTFDRNFKRPPRVLVALNRLDVGKEDNLRINTYFSDIYYHIRAEGRFIPILSRHEPATSWPLLVVIFIGRGYPAKVPIGAPRGRPATPLFDIVVGIIA